MSYQLRIEKKNLKQLKKEEKTIVEMILRWLKNNVDCTATPGQYGKALVGDKKGLWRYRIGNYRAICQIRDHQLLVLAVEIGHRKDIYK